MKSIEERRQRFSLTLLFSGLVFVFLVGTMIVVSLIIVLLIYVGILQLGESSIRTGSFILIIALASIVIGTGLSATVGRYPLRSINHIINAMNRLAAGDFHTRLTNTGRLAGLPAVKEFMDSFNKMAEELENTEIPLPTLDIQKEIVHYLDQFTTLISLLEKKLELTKKQYAYYRDELLRFERK